MFRTAFFLMTLLVSIAVAAPGCRRPVAPPSSPSPLPQAEATTTPPNRAETTLPAAPAAQSPCRLKLVTETSAIRRGDPAGLLVGPPRVNVEGCPSNPIRVKLFVDVPNHEAILKKEADNIRIFPVSELADSEFRVRTIRVKLEAECVDHQTHAAAVWEIRVYSHDAVIEPPPASAGAPPTAMTPRLGDQMKPKPQQPLPASPSLPPAQNKPVDQRPPVAITVQSPAPDAVVRGGQVLLVRGKATLPPGAKEVKLLLLDDKGQPLGQATCQMAEDGSFVGSLVLPVNLPSIVYLEVRADSVVSNRVRLRVS